MSLKRICVFCGSNFGKSEDYRMAAVALATTFADQKIDLVYGGASVGIMGVIADAVLEKGGQVFGVIPRKLNEREIAHKNLTQLFVVETMHERKAKMFELCDGFITLPGGFGTFEEYFEILTWAQIGIHSKPMGLLNVNDYFKPLFSLIDHGIEEEFIKPEYKEFILQSESPEKLLQKMRLFKSPVISKWITKEII